MCIRDRYTVGIIGEIKQLVKNRKNMVQVLVEGKQRAELVRFDSEDVLSLIHI